MCAKLHSNNEIFNSLLMKNHSIVNEKCERSVFEIEGLITQHIAETIYVHSMGSWWGLKKDKAFKYH